LIWFGEHIGVVEDVRQGRGVGGEETRRVEHEFVPDRVSILRDPFFMFTERRSGYDGLEIAPKERFSLGSCGVVSVNLSQIRDVQAGLVIARTRDILVQDLRVLVEFKVDICQSQNGPQRT
jgi:hypothetical protein